MIVRAGLLQLSHDLDGRESVERHKEAALAKHEAWIERAAGEGVNLLCLQELFFAPYFAAEQDRRWYRAAEPVPEGPTVRRMQELARRYGMGLVVPLYEEAMPGVYYNTAAVIDADGTFLGKTRKVHIPQVHSSGAGAYGFWEKFYFRPGNLGYPVFPTRFGKVGVYICYDRHFPEGARILGLHGAEIVFNPSATTAGHSDHLWHIEQPAHAIANGYFVGALNRVGIEQPWAIGEFYGLSYFCDPEGRILTQGPRNADALITADLDLDQIVEAREHWQLFRDRRPDTYGDICRDLP
ncbi:Acyltransferase [Candidatus Hydrogenisulfobacillus filiaventi]|uniref:Acyltransferase n=1 Tax=Candidatus Hydrogenisulfobacillus filiaventi TaxID=2707344 RepID=A0A6F8ZE70_9FIRM|nr:Acyltransferase [Candidatus Hydrogenisulfobacillus filiaventi]